MISVPYRILIISALFTTIIIGIVFAGTTGKITGKVTDKQTGETLIGVSVMVQGTSLGASTDIEGYYTILHVPPGTHTVITSHVGYTQVTVTGVNVNIDQTTPIDIQMVSREIETGVVEVVAERKVVKRDVSTSVAAVRSEEITSLPATTVSEVIGMQAGVEDGLVVRGDASNSLLFQMDGVTMRDPRNNKPISSVALSAIKEVSVERGGFNAEYGQVRSGIINVIQKEGDAASYFGSVTVRYSPPTPKYFGISVYDPNSMWNKPYLDPAVCWTGTENGAWDKYTQRQYPRFEGWNAVSQALLKDSDPNNDLSPVAAQKVWMWERRRRPETNQPDYTIDGGFGGPMPLVSEMLGNLRFFTSYRLEREMLLIPLSRPDYKEYTWSIKMNSDISKNMYLMLNASTGKSYNVALNADDRQFNNNTFGIDGQTFWNATDFQRTPLEIAQQLADQRPSRIFTDSWYGEADVSSMVLAGKFTHFVTASTFYEISFERVTREYETGPIRGRDFSEKYEIVPGYFVDEAPFGYDPVPNAGITGMFFGGHSSTIRDSSKISSNIFKGDFTTQINKENLLKTGFEFSYYDLNLNYGLDNVFFGDVNYVKQKWNPYRFSLYAQDKLEAFGFVGNFGLRMDLSNPNTEWVLVDVFDKAYYGSSYNENVSYPKEKAKIDIALSPRLGISHPITEDSKLFFNYGHFKEMPAYEEIFRLGRSAGGTMRNSGNPNLVQAKTISYELGYEHCLFDIYLLQLSAFYNDISNVQAYTAYLSDQKGIGYYEANNNGYQDVRGFELTLRKTEGEWIRGFVNYTYQVSTRGAFGKATINEDPSQQKLIDDNTLNQYQQKPVPQPRANASITLLTPRSFGPSVGGIQPLGEWIITFLAQWRAGGYITYNPKQVIEIINNVQLTSHYNIDLRINKNFEFKYFSTMLFVEIRNMLNTKRLSGASFYDVYDQQYYFESLHLPTSKAYDNIEGDDRAGDVRKEGVAYQPIEQSGNVNNIPVASINSSVIYYDRITKKYMNYLNGAWSEVDKGRMQKILDDKAYIDMPNNSSFDFLNPRQVFFGISLSFKI